nr:hypothetical protein CFP56_57974 [Quercus suber]
MTSVGSEGTECDVVGSEGESATSSMVLRVRKCGLIYFLCRPDNFFLLNPATHEYARIPDAPFSNPILAYGFSYASSIYDYKLVVLIKHELLVAVFSVITGLWKMVEGFQFRYIGTAVMRADMGRISKAFSTRTQEHQ